MLIRTECGRCTDNCPAWATDKTLSPRDIVTKLRHFATANGGTIYKDEYLPSDDWVTPEELYAALHVVLVLNNALYLLIKWAK